MDEINPTAVVLLVVALLLCVFFLSPLWPLPLCAGAVLILWSKIAPSTTSSTDGGHTLMSRESEIQLPALWDERQIGAAPEKYKDSPSVLSKYVDSILTRFVVGQEQRTMETRTRYLETFNKYAEIARESYKWHRYMTGGRAKLEEDAKDTKAEAVLREEQAKLELLDLDADIQRARKELELKKLRKEIENVDKTTPPPPPAPAPPRQPSTSEVREQKRQSLNAREKRVRDEIQVTHSDPTLTEEQRQRKLNALEERLSEIHEEQMQLL
jgi:hypothetical protein